MEILHLNRSLRRNASLAVLAGAQPRQTRRGEADWGGGTASIRSQITQTLRAAISSGTLLPGEKLSDAQLCAKLGVSRTSVREALRYLESEKLITVKGSRMLVSRLDQPQVETIFKLLGQFIGECVAQIAERISAAHFALVRGVHSELSGMLQSGRLREAGMVVGRFYVLVLEAYGDAVIQDMVQQLLTRSGFVRGRARLDEARALGSVREILDISTAILAGHPARAQGAARQHFAAEMLAACEVVRNGAAR